MRRTSVYFISILLVIISSPVLTYAQDTIIFPLKIKVGLEVSGPVIYLIEKNNLTVEGYISSDINEKFSLVFGGGYVDYNYSQYNYEYLNKGYFIRTGTDINLLKPEKSLGKYWVGIGLRYGLSVFNSEYPSYNQENYWGKTFSSIAPQTNLGHFIEVSPGARAEIFKNFSMGWNFSLRILLHTNASKDLRPIMVPGFGNAGQTLSAGLKYFIVWNIPYKKIKVITKIEETEETEDTEVPVEPGNRQQSTGIRP